MKLSFEKKLFIVLVLFGLAISFVAVIRFFHEARHDTEGVAIGKMSQAEQKREVWLTIFVHGSFGSTLGLLNAYQVINDNVEGTSYKKVVSKMRRDPFFFREQPLLQKGLVWVRPTFDLRKNDGKKYAAYPMCNVYKEMTEKVCPGKEKNYFYTFGWSGLVSQRRRRLEAVRFYNELDSKLRKYHKKGIHPKLRVLAHSHGGNVVANIGAISRLLQGETHEAQNCPEDLKNSLAGMQEIIDGLPEKKYRKKRTSQKRWDYKPRSKKLAIDEVILWGMPVQPETDTLFASPTFKNVYHFYSDEDLVQRIDWFSTKQGYSDRRFNLDRINALGDKKNRLVQARVSVERVLAEEQKKEKTEKKPTSFWSVLFSGGSLIVPSSKNPTHRELWFFSWHDKNETERKFVLAPFPVVVFSPLFVQLIKQAPDLNDIDINILQEDDSIEFCLLKYNDPISKTKICMKQNFLQSVAKKVRPWRSRLVSSGNLINKITKYFR